MDGHPLSAMGEAQAERLAAHLVRTEHVDAIYASPLQRTTRIAAPIAAAFGLLVGPHRPHQSLPPPAELTK